MATIVVLGSLFDRVGDTLIVNQEGATNKILGNPTALVLGLELIQVVGTDTVSVIPSLTVADMSKQYLFPIISQEQICSSRLFILNSNIKIVTTLYLPKWWDEIYLDFSFVGDPTIQVDAVYSYRV